MTHLKHMAFIALVIAIAWRVPGLNETVWPRKFKPGTA